MRKPRLREDELVLIRLFKLDLIFPFSNMHTDSSSFFSSTTSRPSFNISTLFTRFVSHASPATLSLCLSSEASARSSIHLRVTICNCR